MEALSAMGYVQSELKPKTIPQMLAQQMADKAERKRRKDKAKRQ